MPKLNFRPVPEISAEQAVDIVTSIHERRKNPAWASYGALVIRRADAEVEDRIMELFGLISGIDPDSISDDPFSGGNLEVMLHTDHGSTNNITAHRAVTGSCDFILMLRPGLPKKYYEINKSLIRETFKTGTYSKPTPVRSFRTTQHETDLLLFDHSQPHAFLGNSERRMSRALFYGDL